MGSKAGLFGEYSFRDVHDSDTDNARFPNDEVQPIVERNIPHSVVMPLMHCCALQRRPGRWVLCSFHQYDKWEWVEVTENDEKNVSHTAAYKRWEEGPKKREAQPGFGTVTTPHGPYHTHTSYIYI